MKSVVVDGTLVSYQDSGKGQAIICLHGWLSDSSSFSKLAEQLPNFRILALDLPNFGRSEDNNNITSLDDYSEYIKKFIDKLELKDYTLLGHSMGGQIAIRGVATNKLNPNHLLLIAASGVRNQKKMTKHSLHVLAKLFGRATPRRLKKRFYSAIGSDYSDNLSPTQKEIIDNLLKTDVQGDASTITVPTLLIYGSEDTSTPPKYGNTLASCIAGSQLKIIEGSEHWPHVSTPEIVAQHIKKLIGS